MNHLSKSGIKKIKCFSFLFKTSTDWFKSCQSKCFSLIKCFHFRVEENNGLLLFFRTLRTFSDRCDDRTRTFQHFQVSASSYLLGLNAFPLRWRWWCHHWFCSWGLLNIYLSLNSFRFYIRIKGLMDVLRSELLFDVSSSSDVDGPSDKKSSRCFRSVCSKFSVWSWNRWSEMSLCRGRNICSCFLGGGVARPTWLRSENQTTFSMKVSNTLFC